MNETALTVEEAMLLKIFHEYGIAECVKNRNLNFTDDEISLFKKISRKADKHFYFISSRIRKEISLMNEFKTKMNSKETFKVSVNNKGFAAGFWIFPNYFLTLNENELESQLAQEGYLEDSST